MALREVFAVALQALRRNKLRSFLTLLGVIIGVATVVSVVSVISGLKLGHVRDKVLNLNPDVLVFTKYGIVRSRDEFILPAKAQARDAARGAVDRAGVPDLRGRGRPGKPPGRRSMPGGWKDPDVRVEGHTRRTWNP